MIGLHEYRRDPHLPEAVGDPRAPALDRIIGLVGEHLLRPQAAGPVGGSWTYARWKPGTSLTAGFDIEFADGIHRFVGIKRYSGDKARALAHRPVEVPRGLEDPVLLPRVTLPESGTVLWTFPADRELPGLGRVLDMRRTARMLRSFEAFSPLVMRPGPSNLEVLRYKPERRAVLRLDLRLRPAGGGPRTRARALVRCMSPRAARDLEACRRAAGNPEFLPALLGVEARSGVVVEEWLEVETPMSDDFGHAREAGHTLARLHHLPGAPRRLDRRVGFGVLRGLFSVDADLLARLDAIDEPAPPTSECWVHGDFHPDQVVRERERGRTYLLDLDRLAYGCAADDLAPWIADHLAAHPSAGWEQASAELLEGYRAGGGAELAANDLANAVAASLVRLAAAGLRRLQEGAVQRAAALLSRAHEITLVSGGKR